MNIVKSSSGPAHDISMVKTRTHSNVHLSTILHPKSFISAI